MADASAISYPVSSIAAVGRPAVVIVEVGGRVKPVGVLGARGLEGFEHELDAAVQRLGDLGGRGRSSEACRELLRRALDLERAILQVARDAHGPAHGRGSSA